jgi:hypothetical protein
MSVALQGERDRGLAGDLAHRVDWDAKVDHPANRRVPQIMEPASRQPDLSNERGEHRLRDGIGVQRLPVDGREEQAVSFGPAEPIAARSSSWVLR